MFIDKARADYFLGLPWCDLCLKPSEPPSPWGPFLPGSAPPSHPQCLKLLCPHCPVGQVISVPISPPQLALCAGSGPGHTACSMPRPSPLASESSTIGPLWLTSFHIKIGPWEPVTAGLGGTLPEDLVLLDLEEVGPLFHLCWALNPREAPAFNLRGGPWAVRTVWVPSLPEELGLWGDRDPGGAPRSQRE